MDRLQLHNRLEQLHCELQQIESVDEDERQILQNLMRDIKRLVGAGDSDQHLVYARLGERLQTDDKEIITIRGVDYEVILRQDAYSDYARRTFAERRALDESGVVATLFLTRIRDRVGVWADEYRDGHIGRVSRGNESAIELHIRDFISDWMMVFRKKPIRTIAWTVLIISIVCWVIFQLV